MIKRADSRLVWHCRWPCGIGSTRRPTRRPLKDVSNRPGLEVSSVRSDHGPAPYEAQLIDSPHPAPSSTSARDVRFGPVSLDSGVDPSKNPGEPGRKGIARIRVCIPGSRSVTASMRPPMGWSSR